MQDQQAAPTAEFETPTENSLIRQRLGAFASPGAGTMPMAPATAPLTNGTETVPLAAPPQTAPIPAQYPNQPDPANTAGTVPFAPPTPVTMPFATPPSSQDA